MTNDELILQKLSEISDRLTTIEKKQDDHTEILHEHTEILNEHTEILNEHTKVLAEHTEILSEHTEILAEHSVALNTLLEWADDVQSTVKIPFAKPST